MMRRSHLLAASALVLLACEPATTTTNPGDGTEALERIDTTESPSDAGTQADAKGPVDKGKALPKVRDRDPEEEKKKLALSHQRSAEAQKMLAGNRLTEALDHSRQALKIHEQNVEAMLVMAEVYYKQKKFELVQAVTSTALAVDAKIRTPQETSRAHNLKGFAYSAMGNDNLATQAFKMAAEADEKNAGAWNNLGTRYMQAGDVATAKQCFAYALELDATFAKAHLNLGAALRAEGKWQDAEKSLLTAMKLRPNYPEAYFNLGVLYLDADPYPGLETMPRLEKAIGFLTKYRDLAIADGPEGPGPSSKKSGPKVQPGPAAVSKARADDYIRVAKKGIEREQRRIEREKGRASKPEPAKPGDASKPAPAGAGDAATGDPAAADPTEDGGEAAPTKPGAPSKPTTQTPGATPSKPTTQTPGATPSKPATQTPGAPATPSKPATQTPGAPSKPATQSPGAKPASPPSSPSDLPATKPAPTQPQKPGASTPTPSKPTTTAPTQPSTPPPATKPTASPPPATPTKPSAPPPATPTKPQTPTQTPTQKPAAPPPAAKSASHARGCDRAFAPSSAPHEASCIDPTAAWNTRTCVDTHCLASRSPGVASSWPASQQSQRHVLRGARA